VDGRVLPSDRRRPGRPRRRRRDALSDTQHEPPLDPETEERIDAPIPAEVERETRLTPAQAVEAMRIRVPVRGNRPLRALIERVNDDRQLKGWWHVSNVNATVRMEINDHSWVHIQIVTNIALKLLRLLVKHDVEPNVVRDYGMSNDDAEVVVALGALLHCVGMAVHREGHEDTSLFLAEPKVRDLLEGLYGEPEVTVIAAEVLQAITSHRQDGHPLTLEAGIVRVADALDMAQGRSRIPFEHGRVSIHSLSAAAVDEVLIEDGTEKPIRIEIRMNNSSGIYQVDGLLKAKLRGSGLERYVEVVARIDTEAEKRLVPEYRLET
jgi:metal-dependent HD superfamily phosphatase/phosphodiesterase